MDSPIVISLLNSRIAVAIAVFITIYLSFLLIRLFADFFLVTIAIGSAFLVYQISDPVWYGIYTTILTETPVLKGMFSNPLPVPADPATILSIATIVTILAIIISLPFLPFSATYRVLLGIELPAFKRKEGKVRHWIRQEIRKFLKNE